MDRILIVGLGNIGKEYDITRHNVGFMFVDWLASFLGAGDFAPRKHSSSIAEVSRGGVLITLMKPSTFMNLSGNAVSSWKSFYKSENSSIIVAYDDASVELGRVKITKGGGSGGHNGIKSVTACIGEDYFRIKFGIKKDYPGSLESFVLGKMSQEEVGAMRLNFDILAKNLDLLLSRDLESFSKILNQIAQK